MAQYKVLKDFRDKETGELYLADKFFESSDENRIAFLAEKGFIETETASSLEVDFTGQVKHVGGGWYQLPNGEKIQGKEEALAAFEELQKSGE